MIECQDSAEVVNFASPAALDNLWSGGGSVAFWLRTFTVNAYRTCTEKGIIPGDGWEIIHENTGVIGLGFQWSGGYYYFGSSSTLSNATLHHVVVTYDESSTSNDATIFIDAVDAGGARPGWVSISGSAQDDAAYDMGVGNRAAPTTQNVQGAIGDFRVYGHELSAAEVAAIYHRRGRRGDGVPGCTFRAPLAELADGAAASGTDVCRDVIGGNHGTPAGSPPYRYYPGLYR